MVARKEAATHTHTPEIRRGQRPESQKPTLIRLSTAAAAAVRAGACRTVAVLLSASLPTVLCTGGLERSAGFSEKIAPRQQFSFLSDRVRIARLLAHCAQLVPCEVTAVCRGCPLER